MQKIASIHGVLVSIDLRGVLILGDPGVGKSQLALALLDRGHVFIADDLVLVSLDDDGQLIGVAAEVYQGFLAVREVGLLDVKKLYPNQVLPSVTIDMVIKLYQDHQRFKTTEGHDLTAIQSKTQILGKSLITYKLFTGANRPLALLLECMVKRLNT